jgi:transcriptional regulator with GAF, ATPase, and Fis domain
MVGRGHGLTGHDTLSREHFKVHWNRALCAHALTDQGSRNGTLKNGRPLDHEGVPIEHNDVIRAGDLLFVYERGEGPDDVPRLHTAIPGVSLAAAALRCSALQVAARPGSVLLLGETGTGKEYVASAVHGESGRSGPFIAVNCAALSASVVESQLFGHEKGAFTGAERAHGGFFRAAAGGTLFLDEVGDMPIDLQPKLLRAVAVGEIYSVGSAESDIVDVRVVAATNRPLAADVEAGRFRRDLFARLSVWEIQLPPLKERRADILGWLERLYRGIAQGDPARIALDATTAEQLLLHPWPDNLRGLHKLAHRLLVNPGDVTLPPIAPEAISRPLPANARAPRSLAELEQVISREGTVAAAARYYGRDRRQVYRWMESFGLKR